VFCGNLPVLTVFLKIALLSGGELFEQILNERNFTEKVAAILVKQMLSCVFYMHTQGYAHR